MIMDKKLYIQAYTVRDMLNTEEECDSTFKSLASYGFAGVQTAGVKAPFENYSAALKRAGLSCIGTHISIDTLLNGDEAERVHKLLGTTNAGIGSLPKIFVPDFKAEDLYAGIEQIQKAIEVLKERGLKFTYHHHAKELSKIGNETILEILARELDPKHSSFVLDTYWLNHGGADVTEWIKKFAGRVDILHLKDKAVPLDSNDGQITELGAGNLNFKKIIEVAEDSGVQYLCYEQDCNFKVNQLESAKQSAEYFYSIV